MTARLLINTAEVAELLGMTVHTFYRRRAQLHRVGFPNPVPGMGIRYDPLAIQAWLARQRTASATPAPPPMQDDVAGWQGELDRRLA